MSADAFASAIPAAWKSVDVDGIEGRAWASDSTTCAHVFAAPTQIIALDGMTPAFAALAATIVLAAPDYGPEMATLLWSCNLAIRELAIMGGEDYGMPIPGWCDGSVVLHFCHRSRANMRRIHEIANSPDSANALSFMTIGGEKVPTIEGLTSTSTSAIMRRTSLAGVGMMTVIHDHDIARRVTLIDACSSIDCETWASREGEGAN